MTRDADLSLFSSFRLGAIDLPSRVVMAPMTRSRAIGSVPNAMMRDYYAQRASAGLIVTEGIAPSPNGLGYARTPGLFSEPQIAGWSEVTDAVHARGGRMFAQLMHVGRIAHGLNMSESARIVAPSAIKAEGNMWTDQQGPQPFPTPHAMTLDDVHAARQEFVRAARAAVRAGFDGVELHGANGYLLEQFLHPAANQRGDQYGGSVDNRNRFLIEVASAVSDAIGADRVGVRLSPYSTLNGLSDHGEVHAQYVALASALRGLVYLHVIRSLNPAYTATGAALRQVFDGALVLNGGFDRTNAEQAIIAGHADMVSFGRPFIANPDLVLRMRTGLPLAAPDASTFYTAEARGYLDYKTA